MSRKEEENIQKKQRCKDCGRRVGVQPDGRLVQHKCNPEREKKKAKPPIAQA